MLNFKQIQHSKLILLTLMLFFFPIKFLENLIVGKIFTNYTFTCSKLTIDTLEPIIKYAPS